MTILSKYRSISCTLLLSFWLLTATTTVRAQTASPTVAPTTSLQPTVSEVEVRESLQDRLRRAAEDKTDEAKKILGSSDRRAIVGTLKDLSSNTLTIQLKNGGTRMSSIGESAVVLRQGKAAKLEDLAIGDYVIAMGYLTTGDVLDARRVVAVDKPTSQPARMTLVGTISSVNEKSASLKVASARPAELGGAEDFEVNVSKTANFEIASAAEGTKILIVGILSSKDPHSLTAKAIKLIGSQATKND